MDMSNQDQNQIKILIADDDPISRKFLQKLLAEKVDADLLIACDGAEAWDMIQRQFAHIVIADWMMPGMDGIELCRKLREASFSRYVYIVLLTARDDQKDVLEGLNAGADDYVRKPFDPHELRLRINAGLRIVRLEEELARKNEQLQRLNLRLEEMARVDPLMQIGNRNSFYESIERHHNLALRYGQRYGLLMCDVDHFKLYNDTQGHQAGDKVLREVAKAIKLNIRPSDEVFRYGGEEIVVVLPEQGIEGAFSIAQRICQAVRALNILHPKGVDHMVTVSIGAATCEAGSRCRDWKDVLEDADRALYRAKGEGRDRVCRLNDPGAVSASVPQS